jgi:hypothetical protein
MMAQRVGARPPASGGVAAVPTANVPRNGAVASGQTVVARVVALSQPYMQNRLGAAQQNGMIFALQRDVVQTSYVPAPGTPPVPPSQWKAGEVRLREDKRARPIVLRCRVGDTLLIQLQNLLPVKALQPEVGLHLEGLELLPATPAEIRVLAKLPDALDALKKGPLEAQAGFDSDGTWAGANLGSPGYPPTNPTQAGPGSLVAPGQTKIYRLFARAEGAFLLYSGADDVQRRGQIDAGLFGAVVVEPPRSSFFRSQVTREDLGKAAKGQTVEGQPLINYNARYDPKDTYPSGQPIPDPTPVLDMLIERPTAGSNIFELVHSDLTAIITGAPGDGWQFKAGEPPFNENPAYPKRTQPYREFVIHYHELNSNSQGLPHFSKGPLASMLGNGKDGFAINYGVAGIGPEILANRLGIGPMGRPDAVELKFEEFFLSSWAVGDPAMVVDVPANANAQTVTNPDGQPPPNPIHPGAAAIPNNEIGTLVAPKGPGQGATKAYYPDDPSNVYHSYLRDHVKFRILHAAKLAHVHHLHAHQWLHSPDSDESAYLDSQLINGGISYTQEIAYGGSGNRNLTAGDSIFHCHFYPHFAQGMWALWRVHDVFEDGTKLHPKTGRPIQGQSNRALPDGEIQAGTPIPAVVPMPSLAMAPTPAAVELIADGRQAKVLPEKDGNYKNPGYPFFVPGLGGHRAPQPPKDFAPVLDASGQPVKDVNGNPRYLDGGLPRHLIIGGEVVREFHSIWDFSKDFVLMDEAQEANRNYVAKAGSAIAVNLPEEGTDIEKAAMKFHASTPHRSFTPEGKPAEFEVNGLPAQPGAPYADPGRTDDGKAVDRKIVYKGADIQLDVVFNKKGWHYPQQRFITLWGDVAETVKGARPPEPLFFRADSKTVVEYWQTNLVPNYYQMDDFQIRTPTDVIGQHIHLVKFDVTASDGAANGFNYEDSTFSPDEVRERIAAINAHQGWYAFDINQEEYKGAKIAQALRVEPYTTNYAFFGPEPAGQNWDGAQTTVQRWYADPLLDNKGKDRTIRTVFTHDHFSPSTHQQTGLYAGLLVEPEDSTWFIPDRPDTSNKYGFMQMNTRTRPVRDGGPTSWNAVVVAGASDASSYREFALEFQDMALSYTAPSRSTYGPAFIGQPNNGTPYKAYDFTIPQALTTDLNAADGLAVPQSVIDAFATATAGNPNGQINLNPKARVDILRQVMQGVNVGDKVVVVPHGQWLITDAAAEYTIYTPIPQPFPTNAGALPDLRVNNLLQGAFSITLQNSLVGGSVSPDLASQFSNNGITLSAAATVNQVIPGESVWMVVDKGIGAGVDRGEIYPLWDTSGTGQAFQVFLPMTGAWCDSRYAVYPSTNYGVPQLVSSGFQGTYSVNYRNEPLAIRVNVPGTTSEQASLRTVTEQHAATDLAHVLRSIPRADKQLNTQPASDQAVDPCNPLGFRFPARPLTPDMYGYDPYTPLLRAYENDNIQVRTLVGAHQLSHTFNLHGVKWYFEPGLDNFDASLALENNSGFRNSQPMGISEHFEMNFVLPPAARVEHVVDGETRHFADYPYLTDSGIQSMTNGNWGLVRAYGSAGGGGPMPDLMPLPNNHDRKSPGRFERPTNETTKQPAPERSFDNVANSTKQALPPPGSLVYNSRGTTGIADPDAILYVSDRGSAPGAVRPAEGRCLARRGDLA